MVPHPAGSFKDKRAVNNKAMSLSISDCRVVVAGRDSACPQKAPLPVRRPSHRVALESLARSLAARRPADVWVRARRVDGAQPPGEDEEEHKPEQQRRAVAPAARIAARYWGDHRRCAHMGHGKDGRRAAEASPRQRPLDQSAVLQPDGAGAAARRGARAHGAAVGCAPGPDQVRLRHRC